MLHKTLADQWRMMTGVLGIMMLMLISVVCPEGQVKLPDLELVQAVVPGRDALNAGNEVVGQLLVAVHVDEHVAARLLHAPHDVVYLHGRPGMVSLNALLRRLQQDV